MALFPPLQQRTPEIPETSDRIVRKDLRSANWNGGGSLEGGKDTAATTGYLIDYGTGAGQFQALYAEGGSLGSLTVEDTITLGTGGVIRTAATGQRIEITNAAKNLLTFYSGDVAEQAGYEGTLSEGTSGAGVTRTVQFGLKTPLLAATDRLASIVVRSGSPDGTTYAPGVLIAEVTAPGAGTGMAPEFRIQNAIPLLTDGNVRITTSDLIMRETDTSVWLFADTSARTLSINDAAGAAGIVATGAGTFLTDSWIMATTDAASGSGFPIMRAYANDLSNVSYSFQNDADTGWLRSAANIMEAVAGGTKYLYFDHGNTTVGIQNGGFALGFATGTPLTSGYFYNIPPTTGATSNPAEWVLASGSIYYLNRSTSSKRYKSHIDYTYPLADRAIRPVRFWSDTDECWQIGLIAEDVARELPEAATYNDDGLVENYDTRAVIATLAAKVNRLEGIVL